MTYEYKLRLPEWAEFREFVLDAKGYLCEHCESQTTSPQIHHKLYIAGREPWDYELEDVKVLCQRCHETIHERIKEFDDLFDSLPQASLTGLLNALWTFTELAPDGNTNLAEFVYVFVK